MADVKMIIEDNVPVPNRLGGSAVLDKIRELSVGQCLTLPVENQDEQAKLAKRTNANLTHAKRTTGNAYTLRRMYGEVDGDVAPVVRVWRTA